MPPEGQHFFWVQKITWQIHCCGNACIGGTSCGMYLAVSMGQMRQPQSVVPYACSCNTATVSVVMNMLSECHSMLHDHHVVG